MLHKKFLAMLLATALLVSAALPAFAAPVQNEAESLSIVSVMMSWLSRSFGLDLGSEPGAKLGIFIDPGGLEGSSDPGAKLGTAVVPGGLEGNADPETKLGVFVNPGGLEGSSDSADDASPATFSTTSNDEPGDELGIAIDPGG